MITPKTLITGKASNKKFLCNFEGCINVEVAIGGLDEHLHARHHMCCSDFVHADRRPSIVYECTSVPPCRCMFDHSKVMSFMKRKYYIAHMSTQHDGVEFKKSAGHIPTAEERLKISRTKKAQFRAAQAATSPILRADSPLSAPPSPALSALTDLEDLESRLLAYEMDQQEVLS